MTERALHTDLKTSLVNNDTFSYAHLLAFEKPKSGIQNVKEFAYLTDAAHSIVWDGFNGTQNYLANKLLKLGTINETTEAKASALSVTLAADIIGSIVSDTIQSTTTNSLTGTIDFTEYGFREGDSVLLQATGGPITATISGFQDSNTTISFVETGIDSLSGSLTITLTSEELLALHSNLNYINREVNIYKAHYDADGTIIGEPFLVFKGIIASGKFNENIESNSTITWSLTSHWGDFVRVQGRITSDAYHRALDSSGVPDTSALLNPDYATDKGFEHAERAVSVIAVYNRSETRYRQGGWALNPSIKAYQVQVPTELDLNFNLSAKYLPIVYGVRKIDSIPVFVDLDNTNPNEVYVVYAISEGEIAGIYDIYFNDNPLVCMDGNDESARGIDNAPDSVDVPCYGRADRGDVIAGGYLLASSDSTLTIPATYGSYITITTEVKYTEDDGFRDSWYILIQNSITGETLDKIPINSSSYGYFESPPSGPSAGDLARAQQIAQDKIDNNDYIIEKFQPGTLRIATDNAPTSYELVAKLSYKTDGAGYPASAGSYDTNGAYVEDVVYTDPSLAVIQGNYDALVNPGSYTHGLVHNGYFHVDAPLSSDITIHTGKPNQLVDKILRQKSIGGEFKLQQDYYSGTIENYWSDNHRLLDTSYVSVKYTIAEGETNLPSLDFVVKGKLVECYNYDGSYPPFDQPNNDTPSNFNLGDTVDIYPLTVDDSAVISEGATLGSAIIIDKFWIHRGEGVLEPRWRFDLDVSGNTYLRMKNGSFQYSFADYTILPDTRATNNPALQLLDYLTSNRYGKNLQVFDEDGISYRDINLDTFLSSALQCDTRSDVTIVTTTQASVGETITHSDNGFKFEGTVVSSALFGGVYQTVLTDCIGKFGTKWFDFAADWIEYKVGDLIWYKGKVRRVTSNGTISFDTSIQNTFDNIGDTSDETTVSVTGSVSGAMTVNIDDTTFGSASGNPMVRSWNPDTSDFDRSGYSLYDSDDVKYWKYVGWDAPYESTPGQRWVTRHQLNQVVRTDVPIFDNVNTILSQFNGMLRYSNGKYELDIKTEASSSPTTAHYISNDDIIGNIQLTDNATKSVFNSISSSIVDPQNRFESRGVSFFNSTYLQEDKNIPKQGTENLPSITNYYNARFNVKQKLDDSRYKKTVTFKMMPKGYLLLPGSIINLTYPRFEWSDKQFRISSINLEESCLVSIVAEEHNDEIYVIPNLNTETPTEGYNYSIPAPDAPDSLVATNNQYGLITLSWSNAPTFDSSIHTIEVLSSDTDDISTAVAVASSKTSSSTLSIDTSGGDITKYYWIRSYKINSTSLTPKGKVIYSDIHPLVNGVSGTALSLTNALGVILTNEVHVVPAQNNGLGYDLTDAGGTVQVLLGITDITTGNGVIYSIVNGTDHGDNWTKTNNGLTITIDEDDGTYTLSGSSWNFSTQTFTLRATYQGVNIDKVYTISKSIAGDFPITGSLEIETYSIPTDNLGEGYSSAVSSFSANFNMFEGTTFINNSCTFSVVGGSVGPPGYHTAAKNGLTCSVLVTGIGAGSMLLGSSTWTTDTESFIIEADYQGYVVSKTFTVTKVKAGVSGALFRGAWESGVNYYRTGSRADIVKGTDGEYWLCTLTHTSSAGDTPITGGSYTTYWEAFSATFDSVATDILLAQDVTILRTLTMGESGGSTGIIQSWNYVASTSGWAIDGDNNTLEINGGTINGGTITGSTLQTTASGARIVLNDSSNPYTGDSISFYDSSDDLVFGLTSEGSADGGIFGDLRMAGSFHMYPGTVIQTKPLLKPEIKSGLVDTLNAESAIHGKSIRDFVGGGGGFSGDDYNYAFGLSCEGHWPFRIVPQSFSGAPSYPALLGTIIADSAGVLYINTNGGYTWVKVGAQ